MSGARAFTLVLAIAAALSSSTGCVLFGIGIACTGSEHCPGGRVCASGTCVDGVDGPTDAGSHTDAGAPDAGPHDDGGTGSDAGTADAGGAADAAVLDDDAGYDGGQDSDAGPPGDGGCGDGTHTPGELCFTTSLVTGFSSPRQVLFLQANPLEDQRLDLAVLDEDGYFSVRLDDDPDAGPFAYERWYLDSSDADLVHGAVGRIDDDAYDDVAAIAPASGLLHLFFSDGTGSFEHESVATGVSAPEAVAITRVRAGARRDVAVAADTTVVLMEQNANRLFSAGASVTQLLGNHRAIASAVLHDDGAEKLISPGVRAAGQRFDVIGWDGTVLAEETHIAVSVSAGDLDSVLVVALAGGPRPDVIAVPEAIVIAPNDDGGGFLPSVATAPPVTAKNGTGLGAADFDGDGDVDIVTVWYGENQEPAKNGIGIWLQSAGAIAPAPSFVVSGLVDDCSEAHSKSVPVGDLNGDSLPDTAFACRHLTGSGTVVVLLSNP